MLSVFTRMSQGLLTLLGEESLLRGSQTCQVNIEYGVQIMADSNGIGYDDTALVERDVATIESRFNPKVGDTLVHPDGSFKLDVKLSDSGATRRFVVIKYEAP